jgi:hypothetical protein
MYAIDAGDLAGQGNFCFATSCRLAERLVANLEADSKYPKRKRAKDTFHKLYSRISNKDAIAALSDDIDHWLKWVGIAHF